MNEDTLKATTRALERVVEKAGGQAALARLLEITPQSVQGWRLRGYPPADKVLALEKIAEGKISRHALRPDVFGESKLKKEG